MTNAVNRTILVAISKTAIVLWTGSIHSTGRAAARTAAAVCLLPLGRHIALTCPAHSAESVGS